MQKIVHFILVLQVLCNFVLLFFTDNIRKIVIFEQYKENKLLARGVVLLIDLMLNWCSY